MGVDVLIAGGGVVGCATAVHLLARCPTLDVVIVEPDPSYARAASGHGSGGVRQLFSRPENIALSRHTLDLIADWSGWAPAGGHGEAELDWRAGGYLFVAGPDEVRTLEANFTVQINHGVQAQWWEPAELAHRYPRLRTSDLAGAVFSTRDGWLDPQAFFAAVRARASQLGARVWQDRVVDVDVTGSAVTAAVLACGRRVGVAAMVNAAGVGAPELAARAGMPVPVEPMRRHEHLLHLAEPIPDLPFLKDAAGLAVRPHGDGLSVGVVDFSEPGGVNLDVDPRHFDAAVRPALAQRFPDLTDLTIVRTRTGLYDQNRLDGNAIVGNWPGHRDNMYLACGFSGHGFMHAPGIGRALTELILDGEYRSIDLHRLGYRRIVDNRPYPERGIR